LAIVARSKVTARSKSNASFALAQWSFGSSMVEICQWLAELELVARKKKELDLVTDLDLAGAGNASLKVYGHLTPLMVHHCSM